MTEKNNSEGGVIRDPKWADGCPLTINELAKGDGHVDCLLNTGGEN